MIPLRPQSFGFGLIPLTFFFGALSCPAQTALVRHAPTLNGKVDGSVQQMTAENVTFNSNAAIAGDLLVPGSPSLRLNGNPVFGGTIAGAGNAAPTNYQVTLNSGAHLGHLRSRTDPVALPTVNAPPQPAGTRSVSLDNSSQKPGDFATIRNLTLNSNVGPIAVPPGSYGNFIANSNSSLVLGVAGASTPSLYNFQNLTLNSNSPLQVVGPVIITLNGAISNNSPMGSAAHPEWLKLRIAGGGLSLNSNGSFYGYIEAPSGTLTLNSNALVVGGVVSDRLIVNSNGLLRLVAATVPNQPPTATLTSPIDGASFVFPAAITLAAVASDSDGAVAAVEFYDGATELGDAALVSPASYRLQLPGGLPVGSHVLVAKVRDNLGATFSSTPITVTVTAPLNQLPQVALMAPLGGSIYSTGAPLSLSAMATDADGAIVKVEFYRDDELIGTLTTPSAPPSGYAFLGQAPNVAGTHVLKVRAYDDAGSFGDSAPVSMVVVPNLPYVANFESSEGYQLGPLHGQQGWTINQGSAEVTTAAAFDGTRSVEMKPGVIGAVIQQSFAAPSLSAVTFVDLFVLPAAGSDLAQGSLFDLGGARIAFVRDGEGGRIQALQGDALGGGEWSPAGAWMPLEANGTATRWVRLTARLNYATLTWDLYVDGQLALFDLGFSYTGTPPSALTQFSAQGPATQTSHFDFLYAGYDHPLFEDDDRDGIDDAWELANGLDPALDDRNGDKDGDGLVNIREYQLGTRADRADSDGDGLPDGWEIQYHFNPLQAAGQNDDTDHDGLSDLQEFAAGTNPAAADTDGDGLPDGWETIHGLDPLTNDSAADADGDGISNLEEYRRGTDSGDFFNGAVPQVEALNSGGAGPDGELSMLVRKPDGTPWSNAPALFQITSGTRRISAAPGGPDYAGSVEVRADASGVARVYLEPLQP